MHNYKLDFLGVVVIQVMSTLLDCIQESLTPFGKLMENNFFLNNLNQYTFLPVLETAFKGSIP